MSEPTLAALAAVGAPLLKDAEQALAPEAEKVLTDLRAFVSGEADKLRTEFPAVVEQGVAHLHNLAEAMLSRYHSVMERIDAHLGGNAPAPVAPQQVGPPIPVPADGTPSAWGIASNPATPTQPVASSPDQSTSSANTTAAPDSSASAEAPTQESSGSPSTSVVNSTSESSSETSATHSDVTTPAPTTETPAV